MKKLILLLIVLASHSLNAQKDFGVIEIVRPQGVIDMNNPAFVYVWVKNYGNQMLDTIPLAVSLNNTLLFYDTCVLTNGIQSGDSALIITNKSYNSPIGAYQICIRTDVPNDSNPFNDEWCTCAYGSNNGQEKDISLIDIRPTINHAGAGSKELFDLLIKNTGRVPIDSVNLLYPVSGFYLPWSIKLNDTLFPDSSIWIRSNVYFNRYLGKNEAVFVLNNPGDVLPCNDTISHIYWGERRVFDLSVDSFYCQPTSGDTLLSDTVELTVYYSNQGTQSINKLLSFIAYEYSRPFDTLIKQINLQPLQSDSLTIHGSFIPQFITEASIGVFLFEQDSNEFNDGFLKTFIRLPLGLNKDYHLVKSKIFPNPTNALLYLDYEQKPFEIEIYNTKGARVLTAHGVNKIDLSNLPDGLYIVNLKSRDSMYSQKIIKIE